MGIDIATTWSNALWRGDWSLAPDGTLATGEDMETAVLLSLFTDRTALPDDKIPDNGTIRGWWADAFRRFPLGSRLWLLWREKQTETTRRRAEEYGREALQWFIEADIARSVDVRCSWRARGFLDMEIEIVSPGHEKRVWRYPIPWARMASIQ